MKKIKTKKNQKFSEALRDLDKSISGLISEIEKDGGLSKAKSSIVHQRVKVLNQIMKARTK